MNGNNSVHIGGLTERHGGSKHSSGAKRMRDTHLLPVHNYLLIVFNKLLY